MNKQELIKKITEKKEFSQLPEKDVELAFGKFDKLQYLDEEKIKLTRDLLRKVFSAFTSQKILSIKDKSSEWFLKKHISTRERIPYYHKVYKRILKGVGKKVSIIDLGAGINGLSYNYFQDDGISVKYVGIESMGQFVNLMNNHFEKENLKKKAKAIQVSLFEIEKVKKIIKENKKPLAVFLFKTLDSLEMLKRDFSKALLSNIVPLVDRVVVSFATRSLVKRTRFKAQRNWIVDFIKNNFSILDDFELGSERYVVFERK